MKSRVFAASAVASMLLASFGVASADTALSVSCAGTPSTGAISWSGSASGGVAPIAFLWGNGSTSTAQTVSYSPGTYTMSLQATDASSSVATSTCEATVASPLMPAISSFAATPASITAGQSSVLSWTVANASSTSLDNGLGVQTGTSVVVSPTVTTTYNLTASDPNGTSTASATLTVNATTSSGTGSTLQQQIQALLQQIAALQAQLLQLIASHGGGTATTTPPILPPGQVGKVACIALNRNLGIGARGDDVMKLQEMLAEDSGNSFSVAPTGFFGPLTARAMVRFQIRLGIASSTDGSVGPLTRGFFERRCGKGLGGEQGEVSTSTSSWSGQSTTTSQENDNEHANSGQGKGNSGNPHDN